MLVSKLNVNLYGDSFESHMQHKPNIITSLVLVVYAGLAGVLMQVVLIF